jgi:hypothetical protein
VRLLFVLVRLSYRCIQFLKHTGKEELRWAHGRHLFILSNTATSSPGGLLTTRLDLLGPLLQHFSPTSAVASCGMKSHLSPYSNDADVRNDIQKTIWYGSKANGKPNPSAFVKHHDCGAEGHKKNSAAGFERRPRSPRFAPHVHGSFVYEWPTLFLALFLFSRYSLGPSSRFDSRQA